MGKGTVDTFVQAFEGALAPTEAAPLTIKRVKVLGLESRHGYRFTPECLKAAAASGMYEGITIYKDHPPVNYDDPNWRKKTLPPRSVDDVLGSVCNVTYVEGQGLFGDAIFTVDSDLTRSVCLAATTNPHQYGFSHHAAYGPPRFEGAVEIYDEILAAFSLDLVTRPATTNGMFEGDTPVSKDKKAKVDETEKKPVTVRQALEAVCTLPIAKRVVQALEGDFMDAPMGAAPAVESADASPEDKVASAFEAACMSIFKGSGDMKSKLGQLKQVMTAQEALTSAASPPDTPGVAGEGDSDKAKDKQVGDLQQAPPLPIGHMEGLALLEKHKLPITKIALESYASLPMAAAEALAAREVASMKQISDLEAKLALTTNQKPRSLPRIGMEGNAPTTSNEKAIAEKPWLIFSSN